MTGVLLAIPPADFVLHNSLFLVAHFHNVIIGGVLFGAFAGYMYWFPKAFGFTLHEGLGKAAFWCWLVGFYLAFMPLYVLGLMGATRRMQHYAETDWQPLMLVAMAGALVDPARHRADRPAAGRQHPQRASALRDRTGDPWNGRTLEWSIASPPPPWNFAVLPQVEGADAYWGMKQAGRRPRAPSADYEPIHLPRNSPVGVVDRLLRRRSAASRWSGTSGGWRSSGFVGMRGRVAGAWLDRRSRGARAGQRGRRLRAGAAAAGARS